MNFTSLSAYNQIKKMQITVTIQCYQDDETTIDKISTYYYNGKKWVQEGNFIGKKKENTQEIILSYVDRSMILSIVETIYSDTNLREINIFNQSTKEYIPIEENNSSFEELHKKANKIIDNFVSAKDGENFIQQLDSCFLIQALSEFPYFC